MLLLCHVLAMLLPCCCHTLLTILCREPAADPMQEDADETTAALEPLDDNLITLSNLPKSRWVNLGKLEQIRQRNRATETVKAPSTAPFFLSTVPGRVQPLGQGDGCMLACLMAMDAIGQLVALGFASCCGAIGQLAALGVVNALLWCQA